MVVKIVIAVVIALATMVLFRQFSERDKQARARVKPENRAVKKVKNLIWNKKTKSYRAED